LQRMNHFSSSALKPFKMSHARVRRRSSVHRRRSTIPRLRSIMTATQQFIEDERNVQERFLDLVSLRHYRGGAPSASDPILHIDAWCITPKQVAWCCPLCSMHGVLCYHVATSLAPLQVDEDVIIRLPSTLHTCLRHLVSRTLVLRRSQVTRAAVVAALHRFARYSAFGVRVTAATPRRDRNFRV
jgi:hypothetical protein